jgi:hypothetical protein
VVDRLGDLPDGCAALFASAGRSTFYASEPWFRTVTAAAIPAGAAARFVVVGPPRAPAAIFPLLLGADGGVSGLTTPYTCLYQPVVDPAAGPAALAKIGRAFARALRRWPHARLDALDPDWPGLAPLLAGCAAGGFVSSRFNHFGNWFEPVAGLGYQEYMASRPGDLRETVRRKSRRAGRDARLRFVMIDGSSGLDSGIAAFEEVYRRSWKDPEPYPYFNAELMRAAAGTGALRLGLLFHAERAVAAQYWLVHASVASVLKLAHAEEDRALSPGTLLTAWMIERLLEQGGVVELDFGRGDDPYKRQWASGRRQRIGVLLANPFRPAGLRLLAHQAAGRVLRRFRAAAQSHTRDQIKASPRDGRG